MPAEDIRAPRKAAHCLRKEVEENIKDKKETKEVGRELSPRKGVLKREVSKHQEILLLLSLWLALEAQRSTSQGWKINK